jgi:hypothetical protein
MNDLFGPTRLLVIIKVFSFLKWISSFSPAIKNCYVIELIIATLDTFQINIHQIDKLIM